MVLQIAFVSELVAADRAAKFFLPVMSVGQVAAEVTFLAQALVADWAVELEQTAVYGCLVQTQVVLGAQHFATDVASKLPTLGGW